MIYKSIFALLALGLISESPAHQNAYINKPCINTERDGKYTIKFDDAILNYVDLDETAQFLEKNYKKSVFHVDNEYTEGKDSLYIFQGSKVSASAYKRTGDNKVISLCLKAEENIVEITRRLVPSGYVKGYGDEKILIIDESSKVKAYISYKSGDIVKLRLFHVPP